MGEEEEQYSTERAKERAEMYIIERTGREQNRTDSSERKKSSTELRGTSKEQSLTEFISWGREQSSTELKVSWGG